jgi:hypothetical protein
MQPSVLVILTLLPKVRLLMSGVDFFCHIPCLCVARLPSVTLIIERQIEQRFVLDDL